MSEEGDFVGNGKDTSSNNPETVEEQTIKRPNEGNEKQEHTLNLPRDIKNIFGNCSHKVDLVYLFKSNSTFTNLIHLSGVSNHSLYLFIDPS